MTMWNTDQEWATARPLPEGTMVTGAVEVVLYLDADGEERYRLRFQGRASTVVGMLALASHDAIMKRNRDFPIRGEEGS